MRINQYIAQSGITSRRSADKLILEKKVRLNGLMIMTPGVSVGEGDVVEVEHLGQWKIIAPIAQKATYALYKPVGVVTSMHQQGKDKIIKNLIPSGQGLYPVGRLDRESEGLLIITNDGELANALLTKSNNVYKYYEVTAQVPNFDDKSAIEYKLQSLIRGVVAGGERLKAKRVELKHIRVGGVVRILVVLNEGKNRHIRRMFGALKFDVLKLVRVAIGQLELDSLKLMPGERVLLSQYQRDKLLGRKLD